MRRVVGLTVIAVLAAGCSSSTPSPTAAPSPSPSVSAFYPDGLPMTIDGRHVYRPEDAPPADTTAPFLLGGWWGGGNLACPLSTPLDTAPSCPVWFLDTPTSQSAVLIEVPVTGLGPGGPEEVLEVRQLPCDDAIIIGTPSCAAPLDQVIRVVWSGPSTPTPTT